MNRNVICVFIKCFEKLKNIRCAPAYQVINEQLNECFHTKKKVAFYTDGMPNCWICRTCGKVV